MELFGDIKNAIINENPTAILIQKKNYISKQSLDILTNLDQYNANKQISLPETLKHIMTHASQTFFKTHYLLLQQYDNYIQSLNTEPYQRVEPTAGPIDVLVDNNVVNSIYICGIQDALVTTPSTTEIMEKLEELTEKARNDIKQSPVASDSEKEKSLTQ